MATATTTAFLLLLSSTTRHASADSYTTTTTLSSAFSSTFSWLYELVRDVVMGVSVGMLHPITLIRKWLYAEVLIPTLNRVFGLNLLRDPIVHSKKYGHDEDDKTLKVVVVGYGRTGTYSLTMALEEMGYPTLHTQHLYENHALMQMWNEKVFLPSMTADDPTTFLGRPDLQLIASYGYQATADLPMALYYEQVMHEFPNAKFILTTRENSIVWFNSWQTLTSSINPAAQRGGWLGVGSCKTLSNYLAWLYSHINQDMKFLHANAKNIPFPPQNRIAAMKSYEAHNARVRSTIPPDRLLEFNVKTDGWDSLCQFMNVTAADCPSTPFPRSNSIRSVQIQAVVAQITPLITMAMSVLYFMARRRRSSSRSSLQHQQRVAAVSKNMQLVPPRRRIPARRLA
jgi:Sulfotransferase domain